MPNLANKNALGGTEQMFNRLYSSLPEDLLENFQILPTRLEFSLDESKIRILFCHDLANDPQLNFLRNRGWEKFHLIVFVSNWQMQSFIERYNIPWSRCCVMTNAIEELTPYAHKKTKETINLIYTPTPHRGLGILVPVFLELKKKHSEIVLDVYSSFGLYGWDTRDAEFKELFDLCKNSPGVNYHGSKPNDIVRGALLESDIFAYPSIWPETSCICLMEAMAAGLSCVHSNYAALPETSANFTNMYQYQEDPNNHANLFYKNLDDIIVKYKEGKVDRKNLTEQSCYANKFYNWNNKKTQWKNLLEGLVEWKKVVDSQPVEQQQAPSDDYFVFKT